MAVPPVVSRAPRLHSLTALRAFAALLVFGQHARFLFAHTAVFHQLDRVLSKGGSGVSFFFVLSGFVLTWSRRPGDGKQKFFNRRASRIYPDYLVVWFLCSLLIGLSLARAVAVGPAVANLLLVQAWFPAADWHYGMNAVSWSLSCEAFFYLCFPFIVGPLVALSPERRRTLTVVLIGLAVTVQVVLQALEPHLGAGTVEYLAYVFPPTRLIEFVLGILLAGLVADGLPKIPLRTAGVVAVAGVLASAWVPFPASHVIVTLVPFMVLITAAAQADLSGTSPLARSRLLVHLGIVSYAFYLLHDLVLRIFVDRVGLPTRPLWMAVVLTAGLLAVSVGAAEVLFRLVERPAERWWRQRSEAVAHPAVPSQSGMTGA